MEASRWRRTLLDPPDNDLRRYIIHYGEMTQVSIDTFLTDKVSKYARSSRYAKKDLFAKVFLEHGNPFKYHATKYFYATSSIPLPDAFIIKSLSREAWSKESNWMGYVTVATDEGKAALGRRDIVVAWRGTKEALEWVDDFEFISVPASKILGGEHDPMVHQAWYSIYTSDDPRSPFNKSSARDQSIILSSYNISMTIASSKYSNINTTLRIAGQEGDKLGFAQFSNLISLLEDPFLDGYLKVDHIEDINEEIHEQEVEKDGELPSRQILKATWK
ncbi:hypothetical protein Vadar_032960 [Vaccinium darrowii]|uniref:Uncharacterized protein n=1 Tax=Vaccinium darrowii TaxID=229202 RepID=A0ACB7XE19_9ERIC|nr:hypothetical protein Vadar_032960 [Vaccinium darrowii]